MPAGSLSAQVRRRNDAHLRIAVKKAGGIWRARPKLWKISWNSVRALAHATRSIRNQLFHGRWGVIPRQHLVANVVGLPNSHEQSETRYSIAGLGEELEAMRTLRSRLSELKRTWPV